MGRLGARHKTLNGTYDMQEPVEGLDSASRWLLATRFLPYVFGPSSACSSRCA